MKINKLMTIDNVLIYSNHNNNSPLDQIDFQEIMVRENLFQSLLYESTDRL